MARTAAYLIHLGEKVSKSQMIHEDITWSKYSSDKVDIGETLARIIRTLDKALPLNRPLRALSIGSSKEPQFRILQSAFRGGLYLLDIEKTALEEVKERIHRQNTNHVYLLHDDFNKIFLNESKTSKFLKQEMGGKKAELVTLQHSMYYTPALSWYTLIRNLYTKILAPEGALYCVMMSSETKDPDSTTWLYNHFAGKFCGHKNNQDLLQFKRLLKSSPQFKAGGILSKTSRVEFFVEDFERFMSVVWMILLYPQVHKFTAGQREEITRFVYKKFYSKKKPLVQYQDHLVIYRDLGIKGII